MGKGAFRLWLSSLQAVRAEAAGRGFGEPWGTCGPMAEMPADGWGFVLLRESNTVQALATQHVHCEWLRLFREAF